MNQANVAELQRLRRKLGFVGGVDLPPPNSDPRGFPPLPVSPPPHQRQSTQTSPNNGIDSGQRADMAPPSSPAVPPVIDLASIPLRPLPGIPLINHFGFTYDWNGFDLSDPRILNIRKKTVKLRNKRGVLNHSICVRPLTRQLEVTGFLQEGFFNLNPLQPGDTAEERTTISDMLLFLNSLYWQTDVSLLED